MRASYLARFILAMFYSISCPVAVAASSVTTDEASPFGAFVPAANWGSFTPHLGLR